MENLDIATVLERLATFATEWGLRALGAIAVFVLGRWVALRVRNALREGLSKTRMEPTLVPFTAAVAYWAAMVFVMISVLGLFGVPTASLVAVIGAAGLAIGLALQGTLTNFASGIVILTFRPFAVGQTVEVAGVQGKVTEVGLLSTSLDTPDNVRVTIPNAQISNQTIRNYAVNSTRRVDLEVRVSYAADLDVAAAAIQRALASDPRVLAEPAPAVEVTRLGESSVDFVVRPWCAREDYQELKPDLTRRLKIELEAAGCRIPFPQRDVHLHQAA